MKVRKITRPPKSAAQKRFEEFHRQNPHVYVLLVSLSRQASERGRRVGMKMVWERARWEFVMGTDDQSSDFKLNNNYHSRYARLIMEQEDDLDGFFDLRELRS